MLHGISNALLNPGGPWLFVKLVALAFAVSAILRLVPRSALGLLWSAGRFQGR
jgi:hypothetical protein